MKYLKQPSKKQISDFKKMIGNNIRFYRTAKNLSQEELADIIGAGSTTISNLEIGRNQAKIETLLMLSEALGVKPHELYTAVSEDSVSHKIVELEKEVKRAKAETRTIKEEFNKLIISCEKLFSERKGKFL